MAVLTLPAGLEEKLASLAAQVRRWRLLRGASLALGLAGTVPLIVYGIDYFAQPSAVVRIGLLLTGVAAVALAVWWFVLRRWKQQTPPALLAAAIEQQYPMLAERLRTVVDLSERGDAGNGSTGMMALLLAETVKRSKKLDFDRVAPRQLSQRIIVVACVLAVVALGAFALLGGNRATVQRLLLPWYTPPVEVPYTLVVTTKDAAVKRGEPITLSAYLERRAGEAPLPKHLTLVYRSAQHAQKKLPMTGDEQAAYTLTWPNTAEMFDYRVESEYEQSQWYTITPVDAVQLAVGSGVQYSAPEYAAAVPLRTQSDIRELDALQYSTAAVTLKLNRKPLDAQIEYRSADAQPSDAAKTLPHRLTQDDAGNAELSFRHEITAEGTIRVQLFAEKLLNTAVLIPVKSTPDAAPKFERATGLPADSRDLLPNAVLELDLSITDDVAVAQVNFDYAKATGPDGSVTTIPLELPTGGKACEGKIRLPLEGRLAVGESYRLRLRARDNRRLPEYDLGPNESTFPSSGWATVRITATAKPLGEQEVQATKQQVTTEIEQIADRIKAARSGTQTLTKSGKNSGALNAEQFKRALEARENLRQATRQLNELADRVQPTGGLQPLARQARDIAEANTTPAEDELRKAGATPEAAPRTELLEMAERRLGDALEKLERLKATNEQAAKNRLDRAALEALAQEQAALADEAKSSPPNDAMKLAEKQAELQERLQKLQDSSDALTEARKSAEQAAAEREADKLRELAQRLRELDEAKNASRNESKRTQLSELQKRQAAINTAAKALAEGTKRSAGIAQAQPLEKSAFDKAEDLLKKEQPQDSLTEQEKAAMELDRLGEALAQAAAARVGNPKEAAAQLARWQADLARRTKELQDNPADGSTKAKQTELRAEQAAISKATQRLAPPPSPGLASLKQSAEKATAEAARRLAESTAAAAEPQARAAKALEDLADSIPTNAQRKQRATREVDELLKKQQQLGREVNRAAEQAKAKPDEAAASEEFARTTAEVARKQADIQQKLDELDAPGVDARKEKARAAAKQAVDDLTAGRTQDSATSQAQAQRELDRLKQSLEGKTPADDKAGELARLQEEVTRNLSKAKEPEELQRLQRQQDDIARQAAELKAPEASRQLDEAQQATRAAAEATQKKQPEADELRRKSQESLDRLTQRLNGEPPQDRLERLAKQREAEAEQAKLQANAPPDPARSTRAKKHTEQDRAELQDTPAGDAQAAKRKLQDSLEKLADEQQPDRAAALQAQASQGARELADAAKKQGKPAPSAESTPPNSDPASAQDGADALPKAADAKAARDLAKRQRELRSDVARAVTKSQQQKTTPEPDKPDPQATLADEAGKLADESSTVGKELGDGTPQAKQLDAAAQSAKKAQQSLERAKQQDENGRPDEAQKQRHSAERSLEDAARQARGNSPGKPANTEAGENLRRAEKLMQAGKQAMQGGKPNAAAAAGGQAAKSLQDSAAQLAKGDGPPSSDGNKEGQGQGQGSTPGQGGGSASGELPSLLVQNLGKNWGELPGETKSQIVQELKAKYGSDYARLIKLYFEQLADRK